jgi:arsenate reductase
MNVSEFRMVIPATRRMTWIFREWRGSDQWPEPHSRLEIRDSGLVSSARFESRISMHLEWHTCQMASFTIYHNPRCTKSRLTLARLEEHGIKPEVIEYLKTPPTAAELTGIVAKLGIEPERLVRRNEEIYKELYAGKELTARQWIEAMVEHPILIERPIVIHGGKAVIGRPPENVDALLK